MTGFRTSSNSPIALPYNGINVKAPISNLSNEYAPWMQNFFANGQTLPVRNGSGLQSILSVATSNITNTGLFAYSSSQLFGVMEYNSGPTVNSIIDFSSTNASVAAASSIDASNTAKPVRFRNYLYYFNAGNTPMYYDGSTWTSGAPFTGPTFTGGTGSIYTGCGYRNRLYLTEFFDTSVWYGGVNSVSGAMTELDLKSLMAYGGSLVGCYSISFSDNTQAQAALAFLTTTGEVLFFEGAYPESPDWKLISRAKLARPVSLINPEILYQGDTLIITDAGLVSLRQVLTQGSNAGLYATISENIDPLWSKLVEATRAYSNSQAVNGAFFSKDGCIYISFPIVLSRNGNNYYYDSNNPATGGTFLVFNTLTGAWFPYIYNTPSNTYVYNMVEFGSKLVCSLLEKNYVIELEKPDTYQDINFNNTSLTEGITASIVSAAFINPNAGGVIKNDAISLYSYLGASVTSAISCALLENFGQRTTPTSRPKVIINSFNETKISIGSVAPYVQYVLSAQTNSASGQPTTLYAINVLNESGGFG